ncbi:MAG TPA: TlpA disulfide reductase family protein [Streptosporangiaceae bacterium]|nr:TlpA disulfide reductase family protein [Streptosporangiaceae bacterium]
MKPRRGGRIRRPGGSIRRSALLTGVAVVLLAFVAVGVLTAGGSARPATPKPARPFALSRLGDPGKRVALRADAGRPVIINFFASWCAPCRKETPLLAGFYRSHHGRILIIGVDANDKSSAALAFLRAHAVGYPVGYDPSAAVAVSYGVAALPQTFFLNARHQIVRHILGAVTARDLNSWAASLARQSGAS